jgi:putative endonuclease
VRQNSWQESNRETFHGWIESHPERAGTTRRGIATQQTTLVLISENRLFVDTIAMTSKIELRPPEPCWLYFIECRSGAIYIGISRDVNSRYNLHLNGKGARYTRMNPPRRLIGSKEYGNRTEAARAEISCKQLTAEEKWSLVSTLFPQDCR